MISCHFCCCRNAQQHEIELYDFGGCLLLCALFQPTYLQPSAYSAASSRHPNSQARRHYSIGWGLLDHLTSRLASTTPCATISTHTTLAAGTTCRCTRISAQRTSTRTRHESSFARSIRQSRSGSGKLVLSARRRLRQRSLPALSWMGVDSHTRHHRRRRERTRHEDCSHC